MVKVVDAMGKQCPVPVIEAKKAIESMEEPGKIEVHVDNQTAVENLKRLGDKMNGVVTVETLAGAHFVVTIALEEDRMGETSADCSCSEIIVTEDNTVVVFDGNTMGRGSDELGATLMKGFIYALSQLEKLPKTCLFYNSGAKLTGEGSDSLEDLKAMEAAGVTIKTCGTCANFYDLEGKICVGTVTNMYDIVETMNESSKIIKP